MFEVRIHGRGGQGVVTAAELLSVAAFLDGAHAQAFPSFGSERTGAPVVAFCRIAEQPIRSREPVLAPDAVVIQDASLLHQVDVFGGLREDGFTLINSSRSVDQLGIGEWSATRPAGHVRTIAATELARRYTGSLDSVVAAIDQRLPAGNGDAARACYAELLAARVA